VGHCATKEIMQPIIKVENLGKSYLIGHQRESYTALRDVLTNKARQTFTNAKKFFSGGQLIAGNEMEEFWALKDINFEVNQGDRVGIIGRNGAGKSTLLKVLSRITEPTTGRIQLKGRVASLLEVGTGFHPELSGRENIYLNGAILGMGRAEVRKKFDEIVDFAGVEKFLDTPVKRYSSGMYVRLAFAVAAHLEPEILIVDEVLAVGDAEFQKKCLGKMEDVSKNDGRTVIFVSHNMGAISQLCNRGLLIESGNVSYSGEISNTINHYIKNSSIRFDNILNGIKYCHPDFIINKITINNSEKNIIHVDEENNSLLVKVEGTVASDKIIALEMRFYDHNGIMIGIFSPGHLLGRTQKITKGPFEIIETITLPDNLTKGEFYFDVDLTHPNIEGYLSIPKFIKINSKGIMGTTGLEFNYEKCGLLILK
jgi:lipopolysaccharide transport system ATP-binding protein